jgi:hypothetical protein
MAEGSSGYSDFLGQYRAISNKLKKYVKEMSISNT